MMDKWDMTREQKIQFIHDLWNIMQSFVDSAYGTHPTKQCRNKNLKSDLQDSYKRIESSHSTINTRGDTNP